MAAAKKDLTFSPLSPQQFLALATDIVRQLEWQLHYISDLGLLAYSGKEGPAWKTDVAIKIVGETAEISSTSLNPKTADADLNNWNVERFIHQFDIAKEGNPNPAELDARYAELQPQFTPKDKDTVFGDAVNPAATQQLHKKEPNGFFVLFVPRKGYFVTPILVYINVLVFIAMAMNGVSIVNPSIDSLIHWGANLRPLVLEGAWWRLITNTFVHIGLLHLVLNMYALLYIGVLLEPRLGERRFTLAYLLSGIMASLASLWWHPLLVSAGASGAIFGMYGVFIAMLTTNLVEDTRRKDLLTSICIFVGYNLIYGFNKGGIDNAAHVGGLLSGLTIGYALLPGLTAARQAYFPMITATILVLIACTATIKLMPDGFGIYQKNIADFSAHEKTALAFYRLPDSPSKDQTLAAIRDSGLPHWNKCILIINQTRTLDLPKNIEDQLGILFDYCGLRVDNYNYIYRQLQNGTDLNTIKYSDSMIYYNNRIQAVMDGLTGQANDPKNTP